MRLPGLQSPHIGKVDGRGARHTAVMRTEGKTAEQALRSILLSPAPPRHLPPAGITEPSRGPRKGAWAQLAASQPALDPQSADSYLLQEAQLGMDTLNLTL